MRTDTSLMKMFIIAFALAAVAFSAVAVLAVVAAQDLGLGVLAETLGGK